MRFRTVLTLLVLSTLSACAAPNPAVMQVEQHISSRMGIAHADLGHAGGRSAVIHIGSLKNTRSLSTVGPRRWRATDVFEYRLKLQEETTPGDFDEIPAAGLVLAVATTAGASITGLDGGVKYRLTLDAYGNEGGTAADTHLNSETACTADFEFAGNSPATTADVPMQVDLDPVVFEGWALVNILSPTDGELECEPPDGYTCTPPSP